MSIELHQAEEFGGCVIGVHGKSLFVKHDLATLTHSVYLYEVEGQLIQNAFPYLTDDEREFILTGITAEEWEELWGDEDE